MVNLRDILIGLVMILSLSACEKEVPITVEQREDLITVNAVVNTDTVVYAYITESKDVDFFSIIELRSDYYDYAGRIGFFRDYIQSNSELKETVLKEAKAELIVNEKDLYVMEFDADHLSYRSEYVPKQGDEIKICVKSQSLPLSDGKVIKLDDVEAVTKLPSTTPRIEVISTEVEYKERDYIKVEDSLKADSVLITDLHGADTVMNIKMRIVDPGNEKNYYRLLVRSMGKKQIAPQAANSTYFCADNFKCSNVLFYDSDLEEPYGLIPAYFSNVFDDELINGQEYEITVETRMRSKSEIPPYVIVELQHLSPDLYYYLKDIEVFRISDFDLYDNPIQIWSNVSGGWGVFGAMTYDTHIIPFENKLYE